MVSSKTMVLGNDRKSAITSARVQNEFLYEETKKSFYFARRAALGFENLKASSRYRYFFESKGLRA